ncbi:hypothetical protein [Demequina litorisediminis]|uniref:HTH marR-type domain-containing protein n=1 Tax=Demequina litorisediminis TaxID=1849022 RepID=A0ABQ6IJH2_9MICO|nr:hypothetical protein [Demequina litorisediminis]GMA36877.1 hypothetical protein GCM10025876_30810 [Demequina litorisediminis]
MSDAATRIDALARILDATLRAAFRDVLADRSTTEDEFLMLSRLVHADGPMSWETLEARTPGHASPAALASAWEGLAAGGWVAVEDGGRVATDSGHDAYAQIEAEVTRLHDATVAGIGDADYATAAAVLGRMIDNLSA